MRFALARSENGVEDVFAQFILGGHHQIFHHGHAVKLVRQLKGAGDALGLSLVRGQGGYVFSLKQNSTRSGLQMASNHVKGGGFACAIGANQSCDLTTWDVKTALIDRGNAAKAHGDVVETNHKGCCPLLSVPAAEGAAGTKAF